MNRAKSNETKTSRSSGEAGSERGRSFFDHEKLVVYQRSLEFVASSHRLMERLPNDSRVRDQLERAADSIPLNIAEGNGRSTPKDRCKFLDIAKGSAFECAAALDICVSRGLLSSADVAQGKKQLREIVGMLIGLVRYTNPNRVIEAPAGYFVPSEKLAVPISI